MFFRHHYTLNTASGACEHKTNKRDASNPCDTYSLVEQTDITKFIAHVISSNYKCEPELLPSERGA